MNMLSESFWYSKEIPGILEIQNSRINLRFLAKWRKEILGCLSNCQGRALKEVKVIRNMEWTVERQMVEVPAMKFDGLYFYDEDAYQVKYNSKTVVNEYGEIVDQSEEWKTKFLILCQKVLGLKESRRITYAWERYVNERYKDDVMAVVWGRINYESGKGDFVFNNAKGEVVCDYKGKIFKDGPWRRKVWNIIREKVIAKYPGKKVAERDWEAINMVLTPAREIAKWNGLGDYGFGNERVDRYQRDGFGLSVTFTEKQSLSIKYDGEYVFGCKYIEVGSLPYALCDEDQSYWQLEVCEPGKWCSVFEEMEKKARQRNAENREWQKRRDENEALRCEIINLCKEYIFAKAEKNTNETYTAIKNGLETAFNVVTLGYFEYANERWPKSDLYEDRVLMIRRDQEGLWIYKKKVTGTMILVCSEKGAFVEGAWIEHFMDIVEKKKEQRNLKAKKKWDKRPTPEDYIQQIRNL